jgi:NAD(P)-dependent dehydrogenase (short-subunit alcohol dehydrogenase family)
MALELARRGHRVYAGVLAPEHDDARSLQIAAGSGTLEPLPLDVTASPSIERAIAAIEARSGGLDVLINNAGVLAAGPIEGFSIESVQRLFDVNVFGALRLVHAVLPLLRRQRAGLIVSITSRQGRLATPVNALYASSKFALEAVGEGLRYELAPLGIDSVIVEPGAFPTRLGADRLQPDRPAVLGEYSLIASAAQRVASLRAAAQGQPDAPQPADFAVQVAELIERPTGTRPLRTVIDPQMQSAIESINTLCAHVTADALVEFGLGPLAGGIAERPTR